MFQGKVTRDGEPSRWFGWIIPLSLWERDGGCGGLHPLPLLYPQRGHGLFCGLWTVFPMLYHNLISCDPRSLWCSNALCSLGRI